jgi:hypothetical protein
MRLLISLPVAPELVYEDFPVFSAGTEILLRQMQKSLLYQKGLIN